MLDLDAGLVADSPGLLLIADKGFASVEFENDLALRGIELLRPSFKRERKRKGEGLLKSVRQLIESVNDTLKGQLDLEQHGGRYRRGRCGPRRPAHPGSRRGHLAQSQDRPANHALPDRVRSLNTSDLII